MSSYIEFLGEVLEQDIDSGKRDYPERICAAVMGWLELSGSDDKLPELLLALMDRIDLLAEELVREQMKTKQLKEDVCRMSDRNYRLERRLEVERTRRVHV